MIVYLKDSKKKGDDKDIKINATVEYSTPVNDVYIVLYNLDTECGLRNKGYSKPYNEFFIRQVTHLITCSFEYDNDHHTIEFACYIGIDGVVCKYLISEDSFKTYEPRFTNDLDFNDDYATDFMIINLNQLQTLNALSKTDKKSDLKELIHQLLSEREWGYKHKFYQIPETGKETIKQPFVDSEELIKFLDAEEERVKTPVLS